MSRYDFTDASDFLEFTAHVTPEELFIEVQDAMCEVSPKTPLWHTLLTIADFLETITENETVA